MPHVQYVTAFHVREKQPSVFKINGISLPSSVAKNAWTNTSTQTICFVSTLFIKSLKHCVLHMVKILILEIVHQLPTVIFPQKPSGYVMHC